MTLKSNPQKEKKRENPFLETNLHLNKNGKDKYTIRNEKNRFKQMIRFLSTLITIGAIGYGAWWVNDTQPHLKQVALEWINMGTFHTLEARFTPKQIMTQERFSLLKDPKHHYAEPVLKFHPYLLMEVKFTNVRSETEEGIILWDLTEGEMVLNTDCWKKTHGFADCINAKARPTEYKVIKAIAENNGKANRQTLVAALHLEPPLLDTWIERCKRKKLIVQQGTNYRIHLQNPVFNVKPSTEIAAPLVTKSRKHSERTPRRYSPTQIKKAAEAAFGADFAIRSTRDVFLPVYSITVQNPDGSLHTTHWNALSGQQICHSALME